MVWLPVGENSLMICLAVSTEYRCVTDRQTDERTSCDSTVRAMHIASHGKKTAVIRFAYIAFLYVQPLSLFYKLILHCRHGRIRVSAGSMAGAKIWASLTLCLKKCPKFDRL